MKRIRYTKVCFSVLKMCALGLLCGLLGGVVGALFSHLLAAVTKTREAAPWIILLLPVGGVATVALYRAFRMSDYGGTNEIIRCLAKGSPIRAIVAPLIFVSTAITHLFGGSAGREGAAIQIGGAGASALASALRLKDDERAALIMSGMSAVFAGVFGTPLTATFFILEFKTSGKLVSLASLPCLISAAAAAKVSSLMGVAKEAVLLQNAPAFSLAGIAKILVLAVGVSLLGTIMCHIFHKSEQLAKKLVSNAFLRAAIGAVAVVALTAAIGDMRYNGSGMGMALAAVEGRAEWFDFILKIVFTAVTLAAGFKGGEIVPTFCIGATFGCVLGGILGMDAGFAAALGLVGLFCCATNSLVSAVFLGVEMFGGVILPYMILVCVVIWPLSAKKGLFCNRVFTSPIFGKREAGKSVKL